MKNAVLFFLSVSALLCMTVAHAEGGCPPGEYPQQGQGWKTCVPIPGAQDTQQSAPRPPKWIDQWQALAVDKVKALMGTALGRRSSDESAKAAMSDCRSKGGSNCEVLITFQNGCIAMAVGHTTLNTQGAANKVSAEKAAMDVCEEAEDGCHIYYSSCNKAIMLN